MKWKLTYDDKKVDIVSGRNKLDAISNAPSRPYRAFKIRKIR